MPDILTEEQKNRIREALKEIPKLQEEIARAKAAGIDVSAQEQEVALLKEQLEKLYRTYVAPRPTTRSTITSP